MITLNYNLQFEPLSANLSITLKFPIDLISLTGCIREGLISTFSFSSKIFEISVGLTDPYNSLFSVLSFLIS